jgi:hypothetical protein
MKTIFKKMTALVAVLLIGTMLSAKASAECGSLTPRKAGASLQPQSWQEGNDLFRQGSLLLVSDHDDPIVGMWRVKFTAEGNTGSMAPPDGTIIDSALVVWHHDGTELMNSGRPAQDGNFCMGVWEKTGKSKYKLNHFALGNDTANAPSGIGNPAGPTHIREDITLDHDGDSYTGSFTLDAFDTLGNNVAHIIGKITATRITVDTPIKTLL